MSRPRKKLDETLRWELYEAYCKHAEATNTLPNPHVFCKQVLPSIGYNVNWETFRDHWKELQLDGLIHIDKKTGAVEIVNGDVQTPLGNV